MKHALSWSPRDHNSAANHGSTAGGAREETAQQGQGNHPNDPSKADVPNGNVVLPGGREGVCFRPHKINFCVDPSDHRISENPTIVVVFAQ